MTVAVHPAALHHLPAFIAAPGETDVLMTVMAVILVVAVLGLLALFTHVHLFWVIGLLLALIGIPDFGGALGRMAGSLEKIAGIIANAYTSNHDLIDSGQVSATGGLVLHAVDAVGLVHAMILRIQALVLPIQTLEFGGR